LRLVDECLHFVILVGRLEQIERHGWSPSLGCAGIPEMPAKLTRRRSWGEWRKSI
jgi:hypothetical protein